ncbi:MAG: YeaH/YhbH family protein [Acidiferrobacter sp.]
MSVIIDRRNSGTRSTANQDRLQRRVRGRIKAAVEKLARSRSMGDMVDTQQPIAIPTKDLHEPSFRRDMRDAPWEQVLPGNKQYRRGDTIPKPDEGDSSGAGEGRGGAPEGLGDDEIAIVLSADEFLSLLFEGLALPNLRQSRAEDIQTEQWRRSGFVKEGSPSRMHIGRTMRGARARRMALRARKKRELQALLQQATTLEDEIRARHGRGEDTSIERFRLAEIQAEIAALERKIKAVPFIQESDLRFAHIDQQPHPITHAVIFCVMDVSGSMGETEKDLAKRFFLLLYLFIHRQYRAVEIVFIKHHEEAVECSEEQFFGAKEGGGTLVSPALALVEEIMAERFSPESWNVYLAQASDGDNAPDDNAAVHEQLLTLLPLLRNMFYLEVNQDQESVLLRIYQALSQELPELMTARARKPEDIYPLFRALFAAQRGVRHG